MLCMCLRRVVPWKPSLLAASSFVAQRHLCLSNKIVFCFSSSGMSLHFVWSFGRFTGVSGFVSFFHSRCLLYYYLVMATINFFVRARGLWMLAGLKYYVAVFWDIRESMYGNAHEFSGCFLLGSWARVCRRARGSGLTVSSGMCVGTRVSVPGSTWAWGYMGSCIPALDHECVGVPWAGGFAWTALGRLRVSGCRPPVLVHKRMAPWGNFSSGQTF